MSNISQEELLVIAGIVAIFCFVGVIALSAVIFIWYRKSKLATQAQVQSQSATPNQTTTSQGNQDTAYSDFAPPPSASPDSHHTEPTTKTSKTDSSYDHQTIDLKPPPLSDHVSEFDAIEPISEPLPQNSIDDIVPQAPIDTLDFDPMTTVDSNASDTEQEDEIGENDATVLMQRPSRPQS